ncbi:glycosyltransferase [Streptomyces phyllanthi]|nr:glycosyltransferase [Streptomyces phyllanthi]
MGAALHELSGGKVTAVLDSGPVFDGAPHRRAVRPSTFVHRLSLRGRLLAGVLTAGWVVAFVLFWAWWLKPEHRVTWTGLAVNSLLLLYVSILPAYFLTAVSRLRHVPPSVEVPRLRVAFVVTHAPSEPWSVARATLQAMLAQKFPLPYDVWLCDEDPSEDVLRWCQSNGVRVSCRQGVREYHRDTWPRRTRCKEGNLAYFYDHWGYRDYDVVAQLDCDHVPEPTYLAEVVRPFADPAIGYVAAPSVCDLNAGTSWAARGRLHREATFHGAFQLGHSRGLAPLCIGSHYAVRTRALRDIGGIGPELAEDFTTTFLLNSAGWQGAFAIDAEAHGEGPPTFTDMVTQEFQWSRSLTTALIDLLPRHLGRMRGALRLRFGYALLYYPLLALTITAGLAFPPIAVLTGVPWVRVDYISFLARFWFATAWLVAMTVMIRRCGLLRPQRAPVMSWEGWLFVLTRWPFVAWGVLAAVLQKLRPRVIAFKVTPKGQGGVRMLPARLVVPFAAITAVLSITATVDEPRGDAVGYGFLCVFAACAYAVVGVAICALHVVEVSRNSKVRLRTALRSARTALLIAVAALLPFAYAVCMYATVAFPH